MPLSCTGSGCDGGGPNSVNNDIIINEVPLCLEWWPLRITPLL